MAHYYGPDSPYHIPAYNHNCYLPPDHIHPNSAAAQLGLTLEELTPILQDCENLQNEFAQPLTEPTTYHNHTIRAESPQPPPNLAPPALPKSVADTIAQLGLTPTELAALEEECIREQTEWLAIEDEADRMVRERGELRGRQEESRREETEEIVRQPEEMEEAREDGLPPSPIPIAQYPPPSPDNGAYDATGEYVDHVVMTEGDAFDANNAENEREHDSASEQLARELIVSDDATGSWAEEMERIGLELQGEYIAPNYPAPPTSPSAPLHQPPPPITIYIPPRVNYAPPPTRNRPPRTHNTSQRPPLRPYTRPQRVRRPPCEN